MGFQPILERKKKILNTRRVYGTGQRGVLSLKGVISRATREGKNVMYIVPVRHREEKKILLGVNPLDFSAINPLSSVSLGQMRIMYTRPPRFSRGIKPSRVYIKDTARLTFFRYDEQQQCAREKSRNALGGRATAHLSSVRVSSSTEWEKWTGK